MTDPHDRLRSLAVEAWTGVLDALDGIDDPRLREAHWAYVVERLIGLAEGLVRLHRGAAAVRGKERAGR